MSKRLRLVVAGAVAALAVSGVAYAMATPKLNGTVGPGFTITLKDKSGKTVKSLKAGKYTFVIADKSNIHNFDLKGPGVSKKTSVSGTGNFTWTLTLKKGTYKYVCDPHHSIMHGSFTVS